MKPTLESKVADTFNMTDEVWRRHANPMSVWTRLLILPLFNIALWSRIWIDYYCLIPIILIAIWTWLNPRFFAPPKSTNNWASKAVLGERVWLNRKNIPIPDHYILPVNLLTLLMSLGTILLIFSLWKLVLTPTIVATVIVIGGKLYFLDYMVRLFEHMKSKSEEYESWLYKNSS